MPEPRFGWLKLFESGSEQLGSGLAAWLSISLLFPRADKALNLRWHHQR
jgi:hypothetical protein